MGSKTKQHEMIMYVHRSENGNETLSIADMTINYSTGEICPEKVAVWGVCLGPVEVQASYESPELEGVEKMLELVKQIEQEKQECESRIAALRLKVTHIQRREKKDEQEQTES